MATKGARTGNYTAAEEEVLACCWLEVSTDPIINNGQKKDAFLGINHKLLQQSLGWDKDIDKSSEQMGRYPHNHPQILGNLQQD
ncbi:hypothetical protein PSHT_00801 [Puccinia striiformis]|uniref:Uncharacterized protein n=1 Tax=Puccinia striiformis TaxID=27350 RepID=A0A2S4WM79_9BASI|nr:hypothetical protein PSHT_00801 [Puccinia striiformis]